MPGIFLTKLFEALTTAIFRHADAGRVIEYEYSQFHLFSFVKFTAFSSAF